MRILVIEDDRETASYVEEGLTKQGYVVDVAGNGAEGVHRATEVAYDLLIVDRMLPGLDGLSVVRALRSAGKELPILFLTALGSVEARVDGLNSGGDDYLIKPFSFIELNARINALLRRPPLREEEIYTRVGVLEIDRLKHRVTYAGDAIDLQPREYQILDYLVRNSGRVVTRTMLLEAVWDFHFDPGTNIIESHISRLRAKIARPGLPPLIKTVRGAGYLLDAD